MGKAVAKQLSAKGANIIIVARNQERLETAIAETKAAPPFPTTALPC